MKTHWVLLNTFIAAIALSLSVAAQDRRGGGDGDRGRPGMDSPASGGTSIGGRGISVGATSSGPMVTASRDTGRGIGSSASVGGVDRSGARSGSFNPVPKLQGTSWNSVSSYYLWQDFLWNLQMRYMLDPHYFARFYRNTEPLVTPRLMKLAVREPLSLSSQMIAAVDELEAMVNDLQAGKPVNKQDIAVKAQAIREMAKKIRKDNSLAFIDQRLDKNMHKDSDLEGLGLEAVRQLREMVTDLNTQLKTMNDQTTTSTVSVHKLAQPSFESLSKRIEKLTKVIESSARRI